MSFFSFLLIISSWHFYIQEKKRHKKLKCFGLFCLIGVLCPLKIKFLILILSGFYVMPIFAAFTTCKIKIYISHIRSRYFYESLKLRITWKSLEKSLEITQNHFNYFKDNISWDIFLENIIAFPFKHFDFFFTILKVQSSPKLKKGFKSIKVSIDDMDKMEENKIMEKRTFAKNTWYYRYEWLMNYITEPIKNGVWW